MRGAVVVEIGSGSVAQCSSRILDALGAGGSGKLDRELLRAVCVCAAIASRAGISSLEVEQAELLEGIIERLRESGPRHDPDGEIEISLLGKLSRAA
jgi:hypothetical protein